MVVMICACQTGERTTFSVTFDGAWRDLQLHSNDLEKITTHAKGRTIGKGVLCGDETLANTDMQYPR